MYLRKHMVVICSKFITFAVTKTTPRCKDESILGCDLLKIHYLCGDKDNFISIVFLTSPVVICSKFITFAVTKTTTRCIFLMTLRCDLLKIHYICGDKDNCRGALLCNIGVVICSKFITFAVTKTTNECGLSQGLLL